MGKSKMKKRMTIQKQFIRSYLLGLVFSIIVTLVAAATFYGIYHLFTGFHSLELKNGQISEIMEFAYKNSDAITQGRESEGLKALAQKAGVEYYIKDMSNRVLYHSGRTSKKINQSGYLFDLKQEIRSNASDASSIMVPLLNGATGKVGHILVLTQSHTANTEWLIFVDLFIPITSFAAFIFFFSRRFSQKIKKPLNELMGAVDKIKSRDLDFTITNAQEDEIGDLARAFEEMRGNLQSSLLREWQLEQDRRDMVAAITHDLRTPLAIIQGHVEGLQDGMKENKEKRDAYLQIIEQNTERARRLLEEMNSLSEIDSTGFKLNMADVNIHSFLEHKLNELAVLAQKKEISIESTVNDSRTEQKKVRMDSGRLSQVLDNLVGNSIRFTPQGGTIKIDVKIEDNRVLFKVCDSGQGFSEKDLVHLFKKFYKGDTSRSKEKGHSGLGLYIARSIIEKHGGEIRASNLTSGGACIEFFICI
ncbi:MAG: HAMP domain-containing histidine kinase [Clostridia bacterium]|nr:HAMP domain-containing histidine kinase [Clostridia bacterium]